MKNKLRRYAELLVYGGVNLKKGEMLTVAAPVNAADLVREIVKTGYSAGAEKVMCIWSDDTVTKLKLKNEKIKQLSEVPHYQVEQRDYLLDEKSAYICIISEDPDIFADIKPNRLAAFVKARGNAFKRFRESTSSNKTRWSLAAYPDKKWAKKMFPELSPNKAYAKLWDFILSTSHLDREDYLDDWKRHSEEIKRRCAALNDAQIKSFQYKNSVGTDFTVGMTDEYKFCGGAEAGADGIEFSANIPTEEVFSSPHRLKINGTVVSAMPLIYNGTTIDKFKLTVKDGRIVDYSAEVGYETLKGLIETDEGSHYFGEIALVAFDSPIQNLKTLFYNTLFDENASCHFAIGNSYPPCFVGSEKLSEDEQFARGLNKSIIHVDFMVGTPDLEITAQTKGGKLPVFKNGNWVI